MTDYEVLQLAHRTCWKFHAEKETYTFNKETLLEFARILKLMEKPNGTA